MVASIVHERLEWLPDRALFRTRHLQSRQLDLLRRHGFLLALKDSLVALDSFDVGPEVDGGSQQLAIELRIHSFDRLEAAFADIELANFLRARVRVRLNHLQYVDKADEPFTKAASRVRFRPRVITLPLEKQACPVRRPPPLDAVLGGGTSFAAGPTCDVIDIHLIRHNAFLPFHPLYVCAGR